MVFPNNNLPSDAKYWVREVEKKIVNLENSLSSSDINNTTRDSQLQVTASQALIAAQAADAAAAEAGVAADAAAQAAQDALDAIDAANAASSLANDAQDDALAALQDIIDLGNPNGPNIYANNISGGTISGVTLVSSSGSNQITLQNGVISISGSGGSGQIRGAGGSNFELYAGSSGTIYVSANSLQGVWCDFAEFGSSGSRFYGEYFPTVAGNPNNTYPANVFMNSTGEMFRDPSISSREAKENIKSYEFNTDDFIAVNPVTFEYKEEAFPTLSGKNNLGFIVEDFEDIGLGEHLVIPANDIDKYKGLRYDKLYMMLHKVVQEQDKTIKDLTARIEALETN